MLEHHLGNSFMEKEEIDKKTVIRTNWKKLIKQVNGTIAVHDRRSVVCIFTQICLDGVERAWKALSFLPASFNEGLLVSKTFLSPPAPLSEAR